jgi:hypothetical protein
MLSLADVDGDNNPELIITTSMGKFNACYEVYNTVSNTKLVEFYMLCGGNNSENNGYETPFFGRYYIDDITKNLYFVVFGASGGIDEMFYMFQKIVFADEKYSIEMLFIPVEQDNNEGYVFSVNDANPFSDTDVSKELYMKSRVVNYDDSQLLYEDVKQLVSDYYSSLEYSVDE